MKKSVPITLGICGGIVSLYAANHLYEKYIINKKATPSKFIIKSTPLFINYSKKINNKTMMSLESKKIFNEFIDVLNNNFTTDDLVLMYHNFNTLKINDKFKSTFLDYYDSEFLPTDNKINVSNINHLYHELFHAASTVIRDGYSFSGFSQNDLKNNKSYGWGINEGYTEIMRKRYFPNIKTHPIAHYNYMIDVMEDVEEIVGKNETESLYLNADLQGLLNRIGEYCSYIEAINLVNDIDFVLFASEKRINASEEDILVYKFKIQERLLKIYSNKLKKLYDNGNISIEEIKDKLYNFANKIWKYDNTCDNYIDDFNDKISSAFSYIVNKECKCKLILK